MALDYRIKLQPVRDRETSMQGRSFNEQMESDRGRAINSAAVRRLQQKTQVFPLETNAAVRSRLTHSLEVMQVGRYISKRIMQKLDQQGELENCALHELSDGFVSAVEIACLLHDVGNPPFGHLGEEVISQWLQKQIIPVFQQRFGAQAEAAMLAADLAQFEGNAQGLRILHSLQGLNLTYTQLASLFKYTRMAGEPRPDNVYRQKKPGYYYAEQDLYKQVGKHLQIDQGCRFPLAYIMEAADDISYCIADLADAVDKGILTVQQLHELLLAQWYQLTAAQHDLSVEDGQLLPRILLKAMTDYHDETLDKDHSYLLALRTRFVNALVEHAADHYVANHTAIFHGQFDGSLIEGNDVYSLAAKTLKKVAVSKVFSTPEVEHLELKGVAVIRGLLQAYKPLLEFAFTDFWELATSEEQSIKGYPIETRLYHKLSGKHKRTYIAVVQPLLEQATNKTEMEMLEYYYRVRLLLDYISGMTDNFALAEYQLLTAAH
ncbi:MAG TPA: dGTPase [Oceanospirillaceae bacterium]|nr:dGTPase [Oceanospirillaceae bacterium]